MNYLMPNKLGILSALGLSAIAFLGIPNSAKAANINKGTDYLHTFSGGTKYDFGTVEVDGKSYKIGLVDLIGNTVGPGKTDTKIKRVEDAIFDDNNDGILERTSVTIPLEITLLSLKSEKSVKIDGQLFNVFINLSKDKVSAGTMTITHNAISWYGHQTFDDSQDNDGRFTSDFTVNFDAVFKAVNSNLELTVSNSLRLINSGADWSHNVSRDDQVVRGELGNGEVNCHIPKGQFCHPGDFFPGPAGHTKADGSPYGHSTRVAATPEPLTILGSAAALGFGTFFKRKGSKLK
ncbi:PEP-CTERM sorting domain-containing protein [Gloeothece verrucosa]|uniref:PEP-CTERM protein-sorting domain-containing protein n=1 Tax=Gloeothece verrucosa (strain PCC 7822) TaxID=497965 RepID=E0U574_GLOV7|nr:PEP-CTERM sorting domain-containing protein [Gloeothece verrucosa]ADN12353.1 hypothetical protein Cyan7822_0307 [Gloeothece verrucosa PCC 7822]